MSCQKRGSEIQEFYSGQSVFITGASGFLGKAVLEKLLRSCPEVSEVYVLLRAKYGVTAESRLKLILQSPIFKVLRHGNPNALKKVFAISGDITLPNLGLNQVDKDTILRNVSIVIHSAASIKFNEPLKTALNINYHGTGRILDICREMKQLSALVHVSTAYSNCDRYEISEEILYSKSQTFKPEEIQNLTDAEVEEITPMLLGNKPNTYSYAKCLAENLIYEQQGQLPICIVRPSIIGATWKEPQPGYVDSLNGVTGLIAAVGKGMLTSLVGNGDKIADVIPLDVCANVIIASGWKTGTEMSAPISTYNCCSGTINPITSEGIKNYVLEAFDKFPLNGVMRYPTFKYVQSNVVNVLLNLLFNFLPFFLLDFVAVLMRRKPMLIKMFNKVLTAVSTMMFFHTNEWKFTTENIIKLESSMAPLDKELFYWNINELEWKEYFTDYCLGIKKWIFKEDLQDLPKAVSRRSRVYRLQKGIQLVILLVTVIILMRFIPY